LIIENYSQLLLPLRVKAGPGQGEGGGRDHPKREYGTTVGDNKHLRLSCLPDSKNGTRDGRWRIRDGEEGGRGKGMSINFQQKHDRDFFFLRTQN
jgi:hypothetical protein